MSLKQRCLSYPGTAKTGRLDMLAAILAALASLIGPILLGLVIFIILAAIFA